MVLLTGLILKLKTPQGTLVLRVSQQHAEVVIDDGRITITTPGESEPTEIRLAEGGHKLTVSKGGFQTRVETFTIKSGDREVLHVTLVPLSPKAETVEVEPPQQRDAAAWTAILPADAPPPAVAPFDAARAKKHQQAWADYLGLPIEREVDLPGGENLTLVLIPPGEFLMGSSEEEQARFLEEARAVDDQSYIDRIPSEGPQHPVRITRPFYLGKYEVTQAQWEAVMGNNPSYFADNSSHPVEYVSWDNIQPFLTKLNEPRNSQGMEFVLPTEAQWEHACRAGTTTVWHCGQSEAVSQYYGWFNANSGSRTHLVGQLRPNAFGLYDMHGNVWEWCTDWHATDYYPHSPINDPSGSPTGSRRVFRGGSWYLSARFCRSAWRDSLSPDGGSNSLGFRVASVLVDE